MPMSGCRVRKNIVASRNDYVNGYLWNVLLGGEVENFTRTWVCFPGRYLGFPF